MFSTKFSSLFWKTYETTAQSAFTFSKLTIETVEQDVK